MIDRTATLSRSLQAPVERSWITTIQWPAALLLTILTGYMALTRSFAHFGIGPLYVSELVIGLLIVFRPDTIVKPLVDRLFNDGPLTFFTYVTTLFVLYGAFQFARGLRGPFAMDAAKNFAFNYYVIFIFAGIWIGLTHPRLLPKFLYVLSWILGLYGVAYLGFLSDTSELVYDGIHAPESIWGQPNGCAMMILALLAFERDWRKISIPMLLNSLVLLGNQRRAEWLAFFAAVIVLSFLTRQMNRLFLTSAMVLGLLMVGLITDFKIPAPNIRGGDISARAIVGRAIAAVDQRAAASFTREAATLSGTVSWRTGWWKNILHDVHKSEKATVIGYGYSYEIWEQHPEGIDNIRTPHNIAMFCLAYGGYVGVFIYYFFHCQLALCLWRVYKLNGNAFGICLWIVITAWAPLDNLVEAPFGAIPFYILCGIQLAPLILKDQGREDEIEYYHQPAIV